MSNPNARTAPMRGRASIRKQASFFKTLTYSGYPIDELREVAEEEIHKLWCALLIPIPVYVNIRGVERSVLVGIRHVENSSGNIVNFYLTRRSCGGKMIYTEIPSEYKGKPLVWYLGDKTDFALDMGNRKSKVVREEQIYIDEPFELREKPEFDDAFAAKIYQLTRPNAEHLKLQQDGYINAPTKKFPAAPVESEYTISELRPVENDEIQAHWSTFAVVLPAYVSIRGMGCTILTGMRQYEDEDGNIVTEFMGFKLYPLTPQMLEKKVTNVAFPAVYGGRTLVTRLEMVISAYFPTENSVMAIGSGGIIQELDLAKCKESTDRPVIIALAALKKDYAAETTMELSLVARDGKNYPYRTLADIMKEREEMEKRATSKKTGTQTATYASLEMTTLVASENTKRVYEEMRKRYKPFEPDAPVGVTVGVTPGAPEGVGDEGSESEDEASAAATQNIATNYSSSSQYASYGIGTPIFRNGGVVCRG